MALTADTIEAGVAHVHEHPTKNGFIVRLSGSIANALFRPCHHRPPAQLHGLDTSQAVPSASRMR